MLRRADASMRSADPAGHRHLRQRHREAAVGKVVHGGDTARPRSGGATKSPLRRSAARSTGGGAPSSRPATVASQADRPSQPGGAADKQDIVARRALKAGVAVFVTSSTSPTPPIAGVGGMPAPIVSL